MAKYNSKSNIIFKWTISASLTTIGQVRSIDHDASGGAIDVTDLDDAAREYVAAIVDSGEVTLELLLDPADASLVQMRTDWKAGTIRVCSVTIVAAVRTFSAFITNMRESGSEGQPLVASITVKATGAITDS
jgi:hypothetical protein